MSSDAAITIDFEQFQTTGNITELAFTQNDIDIRIYRPNNTTFRLSTVNYSPFGLVSLSPFNETGGAAIDSPFVIEFSVPIRSLSVSFGDWGEDADTLTLVGYEGPGLTGPSDSSSGLIPGTDNNNVFTTEQLALRSVSGTGFRSYTMQGGGAAWPNSVFYDNIHAFAVPEPSTWVSLACLGAVAAGVSRRRRRTA